MLGSLREFLKELIASGVILYLRGASVELLVSTGVEGSRSLFDEN